MVRSKNQKLSKKGFSQITKLQLSFVFTFKGRNKIFTKRCPFDESTQFGQHIHTHTLVSFTIYLQTKLNAQFTLSICPNTEHIPRRQEDTNGNPSQQFYLVLKYSSVLKLLSKYKMRIL